MVRPSLRGQKRTRVCMPGGRSKLVYRREKYGSPQCALCGNVLIGVPSGSASKIHKLTRSQRKPTRPFGGQLCSKCFRKVIAMKAKYKLKLIKAEDVPISLKQYVIGG